MDVERLILVPILAGLLFLNVMATGMHVQQVESWTVTEVLTLVYKLLVIAFYVLLIFLLMIRTSAKDSERRPLPIIMAFFGTFGPMVLLGLGGTGDAGALLTLVSVVLMTAGLAFTVYSVTYLGRSFGMIPRARELVTSGPYRFVRHPLYVGEIVTLFGAILVDLSLYKVFVLALLMAVQAYRAVQEERVLASVFPEYKTYAGRTSRFVPGVV